MRRAFAYFSIFPTGRAAEGPAPDAFELTFVPLVGATVGALAGLAAVAVRALHGPQAIGYAIAFALVIVLTGAIHLDGYLDSCDALFATTNAERRLEIMKDVRHGTFAVAGMGILVVVWWAALQRFELTWGFVLTLAVVCATARLAAIANAWIFPYARAGEVTRQFAARPSPLVYTALFALTCFGAYWISPIDVLAVPLAIASALVIGRWMSSKLGGGLTGDCYGFAVVVMEALLLLALPR